MRVWESSHGEILSCGTAAAAAAIASAENGLCLYNEIVTAKLNGGDLFVKYEKEGKAHLDGTVKQSFEGGIEI